MQLKSINIGKIKTYPWGHGVQSAINKMAVTNPIHISKTGLEGDEQADLKNHGEDDKAILIIATQNYSFFEIKQPFGFIGENLSLEGIDDYQVQIGDRIKIDKVILEVTQPRSPCAKLGLIMESKNFVKTYSSSGRVGFYCRVISAGKISLDSKISLQKTTEKSVSIADLFLSQLVYKKDNIDKLNIKTALATTTLSQAWRKKLLKIEV